MKTNRKLHLLLVTLLSLSDFAHGQSTAFTYQGRLTEATGSPSGAYDFTFSLHQGTNGGAAIATVTNLNVAVSHGLFTASVDFGAVFDGSARWLEIAVRPGASASGFTVLNPRQALTAAPYALYAMTPAGPQGTQGVTGATGPAGAPGAKGDTGLPGPAGAAGPQGIQGVTGAIGPLGPPGPVGLTGATGSTGPAGAAGPAGATGATGPIGPEGLKWRGSWSAATAYVIDDAVAHNGSSWMAKVGSTGSAPLEGDPNWDLLAKNGNPGETGVQGLAGATGATGAAGPQGVQGVPGAIGPIGPQGPQGVPGSTDGWSRTGNSGTAPGTEFIGTTDNQPFEIRVNGRRAIQLKDVTDGANTYHAVNTLGGAASNFIEPGVTGATIAGGGQVSNNGSHLPNDIRGHFGFIGGGNGNFIDAIVHGVIGGGSGNIVQGSYSTIAGGAGNNTQSDHATIGGGQENFAFGTYATVAGGRQNSSSGSFNALGGGWANAANGEHGTIGGGRRNYTSDSSATVGGGSENSATRHYATVAGGVDNKASGFASVIVGGSENTNGAVYATIGGGFLNAISDSPNGHSSVIGGGLGNSVYGNYAVIGGGEENTANGPHTVIAGGKLNRGSISSEFGAIGGGSQNTVYGDYATIPGGYRNTANGLASFAGGYRGYAAHDGSFVWSDFHEQDFVSTAANQFCIRATGGIVIEAFGNVSFYSGVGAAEANRYFLLLNSPNSPSASGLKAGGILCADSFDYANPGKNNMVVKGTLGVGYANPAPYTMAVNGNLYAATGYSSSDARRKKNIEPLPHALDDVLKLRGVSFDWRRDEFPDLNLNKGRQLGLVAQEVEPVLPEVVSADADGYKAVAYQNIVPVLIEAIKEQQKTIDELQARVSTLQHLAGEIEGIKAQLAERGN